ncbi:MAG TPA: sodium:solute symporter [Vicinamibacterales bacterium]|nr:sodium:solute symporter [Vicinamibacterales bacterium]
MHWIDWAIVAVYLSWIVWTGLRMSRKTEELEGYFLANRSLPWWAVGLSVMATQLSAITLVGTTGQGYNAGLSFIQFYFGLPLAMIILSLTVVPFFRRAKIYTAYEYLERRFDSKTRLFTSLLFLFSRAMATGVVIAAPSVILSVIFGWNLTLTILAFGIPTIFYTMKGGVQAVTWADVKQMVVIVGGLIAAAVALIMGLPDDVTVGAALHTAGAVGKMQALDFTFDTSTTYTFWSGLIGGLFLSMSYFGCDQSQVQRYLTAKSTDEARGSLLMSAFWKIPLQVLVLMVGVLMFVFFLFNQGPILFKNTYLPAVQSSARAAEYAGLDSEYKQAFENRKLAARAMAAAQADGTPAEAAGFARNEFVRNDAAVREVRAKATALVKDVTGDSEYNDTNYVFPTFVTEHLPVGLVGLIIAAIFAAAMSTIAAELNSLATSSVIDVYRRHLKTDADDAHYVTVSKWATLFWGLFACFVATFAAEMGSLIEAVNVLGSYFYGSILGVFILALGVKRANGHGAFVGLIAGMSAVWWVDQNTATVYLWLNVVGAVVVTVVGTIVSMLTGGATTGPDSGKSAAARAA